MRSGDTIYPLKKITHSLHIIDAIEKKNDSSNKYQCYHIKEKTFIGYIV